jgi:hypothetical protein
VTDQRTCQDFARVILHLVDVWHPDAEKIVLVMDNLNTHTPASRYRAFLPAEAKRLADKLEVSPWNSIRVRITQEVYLTKRQGRRHHAGGLLFAYRRRRPRCCTLWPTRASA